MNSFPQTGIAAFWSKSPERLIRCQPDSEELRVPLKTSPMHWPQSGKPSKLKWLFFPKGVIFDLLKWRMRSASVRGRPSKDLIGGRPASGVLRRGIFCMKNLLGWLRLGWLKICSITLNIAWLTWTHRASQYLLSIIIFRLGGAPKSPPLRGSPAARPSSRSCPARPIYYHYY